MPAISQTGSEAVMAMNEAQFEREKLYQSSMAMFRKMFDEHLISSDQFLTIQKEMQKKYQPIFGTLFST